MFKISFLFFNNYLALNFLGEIFDMTSLSTKSTINVINDKKWMKMKNIRKLFKLALSIAVS